MSELDYKTQIQDVLLTFYPEDEGCLHVLALIESYTDCPHVEEACQDLRKWAIERSDKNGSDLVSPEELKVKKPSKNSWRVKKIQEHGSSLMTPDFLKRYI